MIDVNLSLAWVDEHLATTQRNLMVFTVAGVLLICAVSLIFIWAVVYSPIRG